MWNYVKTRLVTEGFKSDQMAISLSWIVLKWDILVVDLKGKITYTFLLIWHILYFHILKVNDL